MIPGKANVSALAGHAVSRIGVLFAVTYLAIQLVVPFFGLTTARQYRFAWKMFVPDDAPPPRFLVVFRDGSIQDLADLNRQRPTAVVRRPEVDRLRFVPPHLCRAVRAAEAVIVEVGDRQRRHRCP